jgi:hypothetical protein
MKLCEHPDGFIGRPRMCDVCGWEDGKEEFRLRYEREVEINAKKNMLRRCTQNPLWVTVYDHRGNKVEIPATAEEAEEFIRAYRRIIEEDLA